MKKETIKTFCNTMFYAGAVYLAIWKTWEVYTLKRDMKYYAEVLEEAKDLIKDADHSVNCVLYPTVFGTKVSEEDDLLTKASHTLARIAGKIEYVKEECASD